MSNRLSSYLIDGYNLLFFLFPNHSDLEETRNRLLQLLLKLSIKGKVVFDGADEDIQIQSQQRLQIIFTPKSQTADQYIIDLLKNHPNPNRFVTVSSDNEVHRRAKLHGSPSIKLEEFINQFLLKEPQERFHDLSYEDSDQNIKRYRKIFEEKLERNKKLSKKSQNH